MGARAFPGTEETPVTVSPARSWKAAWISSGSLAAAAVIASVIFAAPLRQWYRDYSYERRIGITAIVRAANDMKSRDLVGRVNGRFEYKPLVIMRGRGDDSDKWSLKGAAGPLREAAEANASADKVHGLGVAHLLVGEYDAAVDSLEDALAKETGEADAPHAIAECRDPRLLTDLSAAYTARAADTHSSDDLLAADNAAERAWAMAHSPQAAWNRAIAAEAMHGRPLAIRAWRDYLVLDPSSPWSAEARKHLLGLTVRRGAEDWPAAKARMLNAISRGDDAAASEVVRAYYPQCRLFLEDELLPRISQDQSDKASTATASAVAKAIANIFGDRTALDTLSYLRRPLVASAVVQYGKARQDRSLPLDEVARTLTGLGVPLGARASVFAAFAQSYSHRYIDAIDVSRAARRGLAPNEFPSIVAQSLWVEGIALVEERHLAAANEVLTKARSIFSRLNDARSVAGIDIVIAGNYRLAGDARSAYRTLIDSMALREAAGWEIGYIGLSELAKTSEMMNARSTTSALLDAVLAQAITDRLPAEVVDGLTARAEFHHSAGEDVEALTDVRRAEKEKSAVTNPQDRSRLEMYLAVVAGNILARTSPEEALRYLQPAILSAKRSNSRERLILALYGSGVAERALGRLPEAIASLAEAYAEGERQRVEIAVDETRVSLVDYAQPVGEELVEIFIQQGRTDDALMWSDRTRARVALDSGRSLGMQAIEPATITGIQNGLSKTETYVEYQILPSGVAVWLITAHDSKFVMTVAPQRETQYEVRTLKAAAFSGDERTFNSASSRLYSKLLAPIEGDIHGKHLTVIPDAALTSLPWPALVSPSTGERIGMKYALVTAPSLTWCVSRRAVPPLTPSSGVTVIVSSAVRGLHALPEVEGEATAVASRFSRRDVLDGNVTPQQIQSAADEGRILHFAGHASSGALFLGNPPQKLEAFDIQQLNFTRTPLVTLAGCATSVGRVTADGALSVARAFLIAGAPRVLATSGPLDDQLARTLSDVLYSRLAAGDDVAEALRTARASVCAVPGHSVTPCWAAFELIGVDG
jgi:CHAT domain-containing protein